MKRILLTLLVLLLGCTLVTWGEDLGELAKKEKARRRAIEKEGKQSRTLTNADIPNIKATLAIEVTEAPEPEGEEGSEIPSGETAESDTIAPESYATYDEDVPTESDEQIQALEDEKAKLEEQVEQIRETLDTGGPLARSYGNQMQESREAEDRIGEIDEEINKLKKEEEGKEEGREEEK